jgi:large subunit ribosomal protein L5
MASKKEGTKGGEAGGESGGGKSHGKAGGEKAAKGGGEAAAAKHGGKGGGEAAAKGGGKPAGDAPAGKAKGKAAVGVLKARLLEQYKEQVVPALMSELKLDNPMAVPKVKKVVLSMGVGAAKENIKLLDTAVAELSSIAGQRAVMTRARKSISNFKLREGMPIGAVVTLRGRRMWVFLDRLINVALPRLRDFRGVPRRAFDGKGNYTLGLKDQLIFPEIDYAKVDLVKGMNICLVTSAGRDDHAALLLEKLGLPFMRREG